MSQFPNLSKATPIPTLSKKDFMEMGLPDKVKEYIDNRDTFVVAQIFINVILRQQYTLLMQQLCRSNLSSIKKINGAEQLFDFMDSYTELSFSTKSPEHFNNIPKFKQYKNSYFGAVLNMTDEQEFSEINNTYFDDLIRNFPSFQFAFVRYLIIANITTGVEKVFRKKIIFQTIALNFLSLFFLSIIGTQSFHKQSFHKMGEIIFNSTLSIDFVIAFTFLALLLLSFIYIIYNIIKSCIDYKKTNTRLSFITITYQHLAYLTVIYNKDNLSYWLDKETDNLNECERTILTNYINNNPTSDNEIIALNKHYKETSQNIVAVLI